MRVNSSTYSYAIQIWRNVAMHTIIGFELVGPWAFSNRVLLPKKRKLLSTTSFRSRLHCVIGKYSAQMLEQTSPKHRVKVCNTLETDSVRLYYTFTFTRRISLSRHQRKHLPELSKNRRL